MTDPAARLDKLERDLARTKIVAAVAIVVSLGLHGGGQP
jgi:hypothetical protein